MEASNDTRQEIIIEDVNGIPTLVYCPKDITEIEIPDGVMEIGKQAFSNCRALTDITIPNSVTVIGESAFENCDNLTDIVIPESVDEIGDFAFHNCVHLTNVSIQEGVTSLGEGIFYLCGELENLTLPDSVGRIGVGAFEYTGLKNIRIQGELEEAFNSGYKIWGLPEDCIDLFHEGEDVRAPYAPVYPLGYLTIVNDFGVMTVTDCIATAVNVVIPEEVEVIGDSAFNRNTNLESVEFKAGSQLQAIGKDAFEGCTALSAIIIPDAVTVIGRDAFHGCTNLSEVTLPGNLTWIGMGVLKNTKESNQK